MLQLKLRIITITILFFSFIIIFISCQKTPDGPDNGVPAEWEVSTPESQDMDSQLLNDALKRADDLGYVDCILVIRNKYIVSEKYFNGYDANIAHNVKSVSKGFLSALAGIALQDGILESLNQKMLGFFPEYQKYAVDERKADITLRHLLMMRMGIENEYYNYLELYYSSNWVKATIEFPLKYSPGTKFSYNTFQAHLFSAILTKTSGMNTLDYMKKNLLEPMNITVSRWDQDPQGYYFGGNDMYFFPRDLAVLGLLYLNEGRLNGKQIVPADWIRESLTDYTNNTSNKWWDLEKVNYGYWWWLGELNNYKTFFALGYAGQYIFVFPDLNLIVVTTANENVYAEQEDKQEGAVLGIVSEYILPALKIE